MQKTIQHVQARLEVLEIEDWHLDLMSRRELRRLARECDIDYPLLLKHVKNNQDFRKGWESLTEEQREQLVELQEFEFDI